MASQPGSSEPLVGSTSLFRDAEFSISLCIYRPGAMQEPHAHQHPSVALLLAGSLLEQVGVDEVVARREWVGRKPDGCRHRNVYGPQGAIVISISIRSEGLWNAAADQRGWEWREGCVQLSRMAASAIGKEIPFADLAVELLAGRLPIHQGRPAPPRWLVRARSQLSDEPNVALQRLAMEAGVHRVHLCRSFSRWYGTSISAFRMRRRTEMALGCYLHGDMSAAAAAAEAGFADQSHFSRTVKRFVGMKPGSLRRVSREVT